MKSFAAMKIPSAIQQREMDQRTMELEPVSSIDLMERAGVRLFEKACAFIERHENVLVVCGVGNNGGDGLVLARCLSEEGYTVTVVFPSWSTQHSPEFSVNLHRLKTTNVEIQIIDSAADIVPYFVGVQWVFEALFGTGLTRPLSKPWSTLVEYLNEAKVRRCAVDIPAGLFADKNTPKDCAVLRADKTLAVHAPKKCFFSKESSEFVGEWSVVDIGISQEAIEAQCITDVYNTPERMATLYKPRSKHSYKQQLGHAYLFAGGGETVGAALLSAVACMRSGVGLLTACVEPAIASALNVYIPEVMTSLHTPEQYLNIQAIGIGPGWGRTKGKVDTLREILTKSLGIPKVVDADGIYALRELLNENPKMRLSDMVLTPHKGEFKHLTQREPTSDMEYWSVQRAFCKKHGCVMILKGANTSIATSDGNMYFNATGNPGMATAGSGDVLTGLLLGLLAQGYSQKSAASLAVFIHGLAGDLALETASQESLIASDISAHFGAAFKKLQSYGSSTIS